MSNSQKTEIRKAVGRGKFTAQEFAEARGVKPRTAAVTLRTLVTDGVVEKVGAEKVTDADGKPTRGRPRFQYRVTTGK